MSIGFFVFLRFFEIFVYLAVLGQVTPGRDSARKAPEVHPKTGYAVGEETRAEPGPTAAGAVHAATISGPASTTGSATGSPCRHTRHSSGPATAPGTRRSRSPSPRWTAHRQPPRSTRPPSPPAQRTAHRPTRAQAAPTARHSPGTDRQRHSSQPTPRTAPGCPPAPPLDHWTGSGPPMHTGSTSADRVYNSRIL